MPAWNHVFRDLRQSRRGATDVVVSMLPQLVGVLTGFFGSVLIARGLGPEGLGRYALVMSVAGMAMTLSDLGLGQTAIRYAARAITLGRESVQMAVLRWAFRMRMVLVLGITAVFMLVAPGLARRLWHDADLSFYLRLGLIGGIFTALGAVPTLYFQSVRRFGVNASVQSAQKLIFFAGIVVLAFLSAWSLTNVLLAQLAAGLVAAVAFLALVPGPALWNRTGEPDRFWQAPQLPGPEAAHELDQQSVRGFALYHMISTVLVMITLQADVWLMGYFLSKEAIGVYSAASRFTLPLAILLGGLNTALWPRAAALHTMPDVRRLMKKTLLVSLALSAAGLVYAVAAPLLAPWLFGPSYAGGVLIGQLLCVRFCVAILMCPIGVIGYNLGLVRVYWLMNLIQLILVTGINLVLLPRYGALGAALALVANDVAGAIMVLATLWFRLRRPGPLPDPIPPTSNPESSL